MSRASSSPTVPSILDRPLGRGRDGGRVSLSAFAYMYSELVQYHQGRVASISDLERRLESAGYGVGLRVLEMLAYRAREVSAPFPSRVAGEGEVRWQWAGHLGPA